jgi:hypothetical protein
MSKSNKQRGQKKRVVNQITARVVRGVLHNMAEVKVHDTTFTPGNVDVSGSILHISDIPQGANNGERVGLSLTTTRLSIRLLFNASNPNPNDFVQWDWIRVIIFMWKQEGVVPLSSNILQTNTGSAAICSHFNWEQRQKFVVLADWRKSINNLSQDCEREFTFDGPLKSKLTFLDATGTNYAMNPIFVFFYSDSTSAPHPSLPHSSTRIWYQDD